MCGDICFEIIQQAEDKEMAVRQFHLHSWDAENNLPDTNEFLALIKRAQSWNKNGTKGATVIQCM